MQGVVLGGFVERLFASGQFEFVLARLDVLPYREDHHRLHPSGERDRIREELHDVVPLYNADA